MKKDNDYYLKELWQIAQQYPYIETKFSTTTKDYTPSYPKRQELEFKPLVLKKWCSRRESNSGNIRTKDV